MTASLVKTPIAQIMLVLIGWLMLSSGAARPVPATPLDLAGYRLTFDEPFDTLDVSAWGPGTRWITHTPWAGDFGDARFAEPGDQSPFSINNGLLTITMRQRDGHWSSGLLASIDRKGNGFKQTTGYWEMRAKLPAGRGVWPAFWLATIGRPGQATPEIDVMEFYGHDPKGFLATVHVWKDGNQLYQLAQPIAVKAGELSQRYHLYGVKVEREGISIYLDRKLVAQFAPRPEYLEPKAILLDLGAGGGWPIDGMPNPSLMQIDYVRAYQRVP